MSGPGNPESCNQHTRAHSTQNQMLDRLNLAMFNNFKKKMAKKGWEKKKLYILFFDEKKLF